MHKYCRVDYQNERRVDPHECCKVYTVNVARMLQAQSAEVAGDGGNLATMSKAEIALRTDDDPSLLTSWRRKGKPGKVGHVSWK